LEQCGPPLLDNATGSSGRYSNFLVREQAFNIRGLCPLNQAPNQRKVLK